MSRHISLAAGFCLGLILLGSAIASYFEIADSRKWLRTKGIIQDSKLFRSDSQAWVEIEYSYTVSTKSYSGKATISGENWQSIPSLYLASSEIAVFYNPKKNAASYLVQQGPTGSIMLALLGGVVWLVCLPFAALQIVQRRIDRFKGAADYHMREGLKALAEAQDELDAMKLQGKEIPENLLRREAELLKLAHQAHAMRQSIGMANRFES